MINWKNKFLLFIFFLLIFISIFYILKITPLNPDTYWHLSSGKEIIKNKGLPQFDNFSYVGSNKWYSHEWLFDVLIFLVSNITGLNNLFYFNLFLYFILFFELFLVLKIKTGFSNLPVFLPFFVIFVYLLLSFVVLRPQIFTYIFFLYFIFVFENEPVKKNRVLYFSLPLITIIWVNFHSATILGIFLILFYLSYYLIKKIMLRERAAEFDILMIFYVLIGVIIASFLSPLGFKYLYIFSPENFNFVKKNILEWQSSLPLDSYLPKNISGLVYFTFFYFYAGLCYLTFIYNIKIKGTQKKLEFIFYIILISVFFISSVFFRRNIPLFLLISFPFFIYYIDLFFKWEIIWRKKWDKARIHRFFRWITIILIILVCMYLMVIYNSPVKQFYPERAVRYILKNKPPENIFSDMLWSGYLEYYLYPDYKIMLTGRFNYDKNLLDEYTIINNGLPGFNEKIKKYQIKIFLLGYDSALIKQLIKLDYKIIFFDDVAIILTKDNNIKYFKYIYPFEKNNFYDPQKSDLALKELGEFIKQYPSERSIFLYALILTKKNKEKAVDFLENSIKQYNKYYSLYNLLGTIYFENKDFKKAFQILKKSKKRNKYINQMIKNAEAILNKG